MNGFLHDLRLAWRRCRQAPGFSAAAVLSLGLGIGATATVFGLVDAILLRPLPVRDPETVVAVYTSDYSGPRYGASSYPDYLSFRESGVFDGLVALTAAPLGLAGDQGPGRIWSELVTGDYFGTLGIAVARGRGLTPEDDRAGAPAAVVLSHGLWQRLGGDPAQVGRSVTLSGQAFTVVGVAASGFTGMTRGLGMDAWIPMSARPAISGDARVLEARGDRGLQVFGRLRPGVPIAATNARLATLASALRAEHPSQWADVREETRRITVLPEWQARVQPMFSEPVYAFLALLAAIAALVLLAACANVATLFLARLVRRGREVAVRVSLGAARGRLVRLFLAETLLVSLLGFAVGVAVAFAATDAIRGLSLPLPVTVALDVRPDLRVLGVALALSLVAGAAVGVFPSLSASRLDVLSGLKDGGAGWGRSRVRRAFVVAQVALSLVLLSGALLFLRGLGRAAAIDPGFDAHGVVAVPADLVLSGYDGPRTVAFERQVRERVGALEGVDGVAVAATLHLDPVSIMRRGLAVQGYVEAADEDMEVHATAVGAGFFETLRIPILRGRSFGDGDRPGAPLVAVVNESFARRFWPGQDPLGHRISTSGEEGPYLEIVGVARDAKYGTLGEEPRPFFYVPFAQDFLFVKSVGSFLPATVLVRTSGEPATRMAAIRAAVQEVDPVVSLATARPLTDLLGLSLLPVRVAGIALGAFGALGLALAALGLSGVVAQSVAQRTREFGVRLALGADRASVVRLALGEGSRLVAIGAAVGLALSIALAQLARGFLYGLPPTDPLTFAGALTLLLAVALGAAFVPARRAGLVDPVASLRSE